MAMGMDITPQQHACLHIGEVMQRLVPAVDANDEEKLTEALNFFNSVFYSSVKLSSRSPLDAESGASSTSAPTNGVAGLPLGIDLVSWAVELIDRLVHIGKTLEGSREAVGNTDDAYVISPLIRRAMVPNLCINDFENVQGGRGQRSFIWQRAVLYTFCISVLSQASR